MRRFFLVCFLAIVAVALWLAWAVALPVRFAQPEFVLLRPGWSTRHVANELKAQGIIRSSSAFLLMHYVVGSRTLKAGEYKFDQPASALDVHRRVAAGDIYIRTVLVPEGFNIYDIAGAVEQAGLGSRADFLKAAQTNLSLISDLDPSATSLEGYLFPDTYDFTRTQSMVDIVSAMVHHFRQEARTIGLNTDVHRVVTMASIVEKETAVPEERPVVAAVYYNRLKQNIPLAADPSVIYAALLEGHYNGTIYQSELQSDSAYNTYRHAGLPPGPIANPGRAALAAAMHPAESDYLYFVSDNNGHHRFARTLAEHARNVAAYRRALAEQNR